MKKAIVIASGESIRHICSIKDEIKDCHAYIVNANVVHAMNLYPDIFESLKISHIANRMLPSILPKEVYLKYGIKEVCFTVPKVRKNEITKSIEKLQSYNIEGLHYHFVPPELQMLYSTMNNITFYGIMRALYMDRAMEIDIIGLDFWEGEYLQKQSTDFQKKIPFEKNLYTLFYKLISSHMDTQFKLYTVSKKGFRLSNLQTFSLPKIEEE
jgi:hypothetical protein